MSGEGSRLDVISAGNLAVLNIGGASVSPESSFAARGVVNVTNGADVVVDGGSSAGFVSIARGGLSAGELNVAGSGTSFTATGSSGLVFVTNDFEGAVGDGNGRLNVSDNAVFNVTGPDAFFIVGFGTGDARLNVESGAQLNIDGSLLVSSNTITNSSQTGVAVIDGSLSQISATRTVVGNGTNSSVNGILAGTGVLTSDSVTVQTGGLLDPGLSPGELTINGDVLFDGGELRIEVGGLSAGQFDVLTVNGEVDLSGALVELAFIDDYLPQTDDFVEFIQASSFVGMEDAIFSYTGLADGFVFDVDQTNNSLQFVARNDATAVPAPAIWTLIGIVLLFASRRRVH